MPTEALDDDADYVPPGVSDLGSLPELTRGGGGGTSDANSTGSSGGEM